MNVKLIYQTPQTDEVLLVNEGMLCQSNTYTADKFEWDEAMDL